MPEPSSEIDLYDIYVAPTPHTLSSRDDLTGYIHLLTPAATTRLFSKKSGFLGLNLHVESAVELYKRLHALGVWGDVVPVKYRQPKITVQAARRLAEKAIKNKCALNFPNITFEPVEFDFEGAMTYDFSAGSEELHQLGLWEPDAVFASVDKVDGHIWERLEYYKYVVSIGLDKTLF
jgi:hypothetical protein